MKMRILGLTLMAFFLFNGAALAAGKVDKYHGEYVSGMAKGSKARMNEYANKNFNASSSSDGSGSTDDSGSTSGDGDSNSTVDDVTGDLMDGFF